ncbi:MAG: NarK family nitrate/nitrite MFS transporter [bacterium]
MSDRLNILDFSKGKIRTLHLTWIAFFITFFVWFNHAPLRDSIMQTFDMSMAEWKALLILNVALTIPARIIIGMLVDRFGPRHTYSALLFISSFLCFFFAFAPDEDTLLVARFLMGFVGAGFVIGIRMVAEWFPHREVGVAEGIYGGWGNFGSAAAAFTLPTIALLLGEWRYAVALTGLIALVYSFIFFMTARNTPEGSTYFKPNKTGAMEVTSKGDFILYALMNIPMYAALAVLTWKLSPSNLGMISHVAAVAVYIGLAAIYAYQLYNMYRINKDIFTKPVPEHDRYNFSQVAVLDLAYFVTFGSELAVVSMLPGFFIDTFSMEAVMAGMLAAGFAFMNLVARPSGGLFSDKFGRKQTLLILLIGLSIGYGLMGLIDSAWMIPLAVATTMLCSFFVQSGEGAVFAMVPLVKRRMTGQIAGMVGAYGNVGAVTFLTVFSFVDASTFFFVIAGAALVTMVLVALFLREPKGQMAETLPDGTVHLIDVSK